MTDAHEHERLEAAYRNLDRVIQWIGNADSKAGALVTAESLLFGLGVATLSAQVHTLFAGGVVERVAAFAFVAAVACFGISFFRVLAVLAPDVRQREESLFFFGSIAALSRGEFERRAKELAPETIEQELLSQTHINAGIAAQKFRNLRAASITLMLSLGLVLVFLVLKGIADL